MRHQRPSQSFSGSCATRPAACRSSSQRCTLRRCARTKRARAARAARHLAPAHHRRQPDDELLDRRREARRARRVPEPVRVALHGVHPRLEAIVARRRAAAGAPRATEQRAHDQATRLGRQRLASRPIPATATRRSAVQRHRQRPKTPSKRAPRSSRADARGAAGAIPSSRVRNSRRAGRNWPLSRGCRSVRVAATVGGQCICGCSSRSTV